ncbi:hypothetical protein [Natrarchaeobius oligotrophus]|uniref:hypothetical protein n=1 Tax=Natrarchaeobius oligotrophus TaxID=3455743 RepID=UPI001A9E4903|nr:hypothetical protein [Natrarchaeobius chitinivorans]
MTPAALLVGFCAIMALLAVGRLVHADERDPVDVGTTLLVFALTLTATWWVTRDEPWLSADERTLAAVGALVLFGVGTFLVVHYWTEPTGSALERRPDVSGDADRSSDPDRERLERP